VAGSNGVVRWSDVPRMPSRYLLLAARPRSGQTARTRCDDRSECKQERTFAVCSGDSYRTGTLQP
jgi:hypothetical protein